MRGSRHPLTPQDPREGVLAQDRTDYHEFGRTSVGKQLQEVLHLLLGFLGVLLLNFIIFSCVVYWQFPENIKVPRSSPPEELQYF